MEGGAERGDEHGEGGLEAWGLTQEGVPGEAEGLLEGGIKVLDWGGSADGRG